MIKVEIPMKLPSLNEYIKSINGNRYGGNNFKQKYQQEISYYICSLPKLENPVKIHFHWIEGNKKRDLDNICFAKKFILDTLVNFGKLKDDNRKCVTGFMDSFEYGSEWKVILEIEEVEDGITKDICKENKKRTRSGTNSSRKKKL